jgi:hypothetical protein
MWPKYQNNNNKSELFSKVAEHNRLIYRKKLSIDPHSPMGSA